jgi:L-glutamine-phosphate cytidylyltransferase
MKAIILAAGRGTRLNKYTQNLPKGMLEVFGKTLLQRQVDTFRASGITDISIVKGYCGEKINITGVTYFENKLYAESNMVESLFSAEEKIDGDIIISYSDVLFEERIVKTLINNTSDIGVLVDKDWQPYWLARYGKIDFDTESLEIGNNGQIRSLGISDPPLNEIDGRYVGMIRVSPNGCNIIKYIYHNGQRLFSKKTWINGRIFEMIFMTDFLQEIINQNHPVYPVLINKGWLEFDTNEDLENILLWEKNKTLSQFYIFK